MIHTCEYCIWNCSDCCPPGTLDASASSLSVLRRVTSTSFSWSSRVTGWRGGCPGGDMR